LVKRNIPVGQINRQTLKKIKDLMNDLGQKYSIKVGILQPKGSEKVPGTDLNIAELGAVHEFGANIKHPGGQPYYINSSTGMAVFVSKNSLFGQHLISKGQVTKPHKINIQARSFLREPILGQNGRKEINKVIKEEIPKFIKDASDTTIDKIMNDTAHFVAETALLQVQKAFQGDKIKPKTKASSKKQRKGQPNLPANPNGPTLLNTGQLLHSINYEIKKVK